MEKEEVVSLYNLLEENGVEIWVDGGWGIDALLEKQTRPHNDLDIAVDRKDEKKLRELLASKGYKEKYKENPKEFNFVLKDDKGREIDVHVFEFDGEGNNIYGIEYPKESLTGTGNIGGKVLNCIAPEFVIKFHGNFEPKTKDLKDIKALCAKFNLKPPENYKF